MPSMLLSFKNSQICVLFVLHYEKNEHKHKESGFGLFKKVDFKVERHEKKQERIYINVNANNGPFNLRALCNI